MSQNRFYSSTAVDTTLTGGITSGATALVVASTTGFPVSFPYTLILERDTANQEIVKVTAASGTTLTVVRGQDGTAAVSHSTGAAVEHGVSAQDFTEPQQHIGATSGVHGATGAVVGTSDTQTLTGKTISGANNTLTVREADLSLSDLTTDDVSTTKHGFAPKAPNDATRYLDGTGAYSTPAGADLTAWTTFTPVVKAGGTAYTYGAGVARGAYKIIGKTLIFNVDITGDPTGGGGTGAVTIDLPASATSAARTQLLPGLINLSNPPTGYAVNIWGLGYVTASSTSFSLFIFKDTGNSSVDNTNNLHQVTLSGTIEIA